MDLDRKVILKVEIDTTEMKAALAELETALMRLSEVATSIPIRMTELAQSIEENN